MFKLIFGVGVLLLLVVVSVCLYYGFIWCNTVAERERESWIQEGDREEEGFEWLDDDTPVHYSDDDLGVVSDSGVNKEER